MRDRSRSLFRVSPNDPEYLDNWNQKFDMTCSSFQLEYFGLSMLAGVIMALLFVPSLSEKYGRKGVFCVSLIISVIAQLLLILIES